MEPGANWVFAEGAESIRLGASLPLGKAMDDVIIAYGQKGEPVRPHQGQSAASRGPRLSGQVPRQVAEAAEAGEAPADVLLGEAPISRQGLPAGRRGAYQRLRRRLSTWSRDRSRSSPSRPANSGCPVPATSRSPAWPGRGPAPFAGSRSPPTAAGAGRTPRSTRRRTAWPGPVLPLGGPGPARRRCCSRGARTRRVRCSRRRPRIAHSGARPALRTGTPFNPGG